MNYRLTKIGCYIVEASMAAVISISPILFITFKKLYDISYTLMGTLVAINFLSQLFIDCIFSAFSHKFNIELTLKLTPILTFIGIIIYALIPMLLPSYAFWGIAVGTVMFSISAGLNEVLISPLMASIPSKNKERDMSILHSLYAYGLVAVVIISSLYIKLVGEDYWYYLIFFFSLIPLSSFFIFSNAPIPKMNVSKSQTAKGTKFKKSHLFLFFFCIFMGGATENTMTQWISSFLEKGANIDKFYSTVIGMALFALTIGLGRTFYSRWGKNIKNTLLIGFITATLFYAIASLSLNPYVGIVACVLTGFSVSMLWPGTLIMMENEYSDCGVFTYALMASGGDMGSSIAPQILGIIADVVTSSALGNSLASKFGLTAEQVGIRSGLLLTTLFSISGIIIVLIIKHSLKKQN